MYVDLAGLSRYKQDFDAWARRSLLPKDAAAARVRTAKAGAVSFVPVQETPLDVSADYLFTETPPASGDKSPDNPSTIAGVSSVKATRCGKNLAELNRVYALPGRGITVSVNANGSIHAEGMVGSAIAIVDIGNHDDSANKQLPYWMEVGKTYTLSFNSSNANGNPRASIYLPNSLTAWGSPHLVYPGESYTFTVDSARKRALIRITFDANSTVNCDCYLQIEEGSSATSFDGTIPDVYTLPLGSTYYGGTVDLDTGVMTVTHRYVKLTGTNASFWFNEDLGSYNRFSLTSIDSVRIETASAYTNQQVCTHFDYKANWGLDDQHFYVSTQNPGVAYFYTDFSTVNDLNAWLVAQYQAGTPVEFVFPLATPTTVSLTPIQILSLTQSSDYDPRVNTVYSDAQAVQVGYLKHPSAAASDLRNAIVSLGGGV